MLKRKDRNIKIALKTNNKLNNLISKWKKNPAYMTRNVYTNLPAQTATNPTQEEPTGIS